MIYLYDNAIINDLKNSFNPDNVPNPVVKVIGPEESIGIAAQVQNDDLSFPIVSLIRNPDVSIDGERRNFSLEHFGVQSVIDLETNNVYHEKVLPINLSYDLNIYATNVADSDEIVKEILFKYISQYFLTIELPYESKRKVRFGVTVDRGSIQTKSTTSNYLSEGVLYGTTIPLICEGCVLISYTPRKLVRTKMEVDVKNKYVDKNLQL